ncbi:MAG: ribonuclease J [bacterium]
MSLKFIALSGTTGVTENLYVYEYGNEMIVVDCGVGFPDQDMLGVDLVIPDFTYIKKNANKLKGILVSHGHEDHLGALPFLLREVNVPVYSTKLVGGFIEDKLADYKFRGAKINVFDPERDVFSVGSFKVTPFRVSHSVPDGVGFAIDTPEGRVFHVSDYKFDWTPVDGRPFDVTKLASLASKGSLMLASDSLGSTTQGYTESEREIEGRIEAITRSATGQIFFTTISSNISRMKQALNVAEKLGRKAVFIGRSIDKKAEIARDLGYLSYPRDLVIDPKQANKLNKDQVVYIISGSYGQPGSALYRLAINEHDFLSIEQGDTVIFSGDPAPPGSKSNVDFVVDKLIEANVDVHYYDLQEDLHVSGHGSQKDIEMLVALAKPKFFIPIGGTIRHMRAYSLIAQKMGALPANVFELTPGEVVEFSHNSARLGTKIEVRDVLIDGLGIGDVGNVVLRDRKSLAKEGIVIAIFQIDKQKEFLISDPEIVSRGFVFESKSKSLLNQAAVMVKKALIGKKALGDSKVVKNIAIDFLERFFYDQTGRRPMILPVVIEL